MLHTATSATVTPSFMSRERKKAVNTSTQRKLAINCTKNSQYSKLSTITKALGTGNWTYYLFLKQQHPYNTSKEK